MKVSENQKLSTLIGLEEGLLLCENESTLVRESFELLKKTNNCSKR